MAVAPRPGETLHGRNYQVIPGGKGANQAVAAARLNADIGFIACVGDDSFGINIRENFKMDGIDITGVKMQPNCPTGIAMIQVSDSGENSICISAEANAKLTAEAIEPDLDRIRQADYLLMQLETPMTIQRNAYTSQLRFNNLFSLSNGFTVNHKTCEQCCYTIYPLLPPVGVWTVSQFQCG